MRAQSYLLPGLFALGLAATAFTAGPALAEEDETPPLGQPYVVAEHQDWEILCTRFEEGGPELCEMYQMIVGEDETPLAEITMAALPGDEEFEVGATITTPLETFLLTGLAWQIGDDGELREEPFQVCTQIGCIALLGLSEEETAAMRAGSHAFVLFRPFRNTEQVVGARVSLMGFTAALADLSERTPMPPPAPAAEPEGEDGED